jgi:outer membrane protein OmpA-like peptidoglycan-associated protein
MLNPASIAHLIFRNTVIESLESVAAGQANYAVVPVHNSITQGEGAVLKALAGGGLEIFAQVCMPTSYVLVAHKDYLAEFVRSYSTVADPTSQRSPEIEAKTYTRFLTKIYVGAQAEEQYRGRLIRPDMMSATVEPTRNPLRVLEDLSRNDLMRAMLTVPRGGLQQQGGGYGNTPYNPGGSGAAIRADIPAPPVLDTVQAPAALVASGLLDAPGDPEGWDRQGSLGEIVQLLRNLLVLLNVYSFGPPDLPLNTTQYLLVGRKGLRLDANALNSPSAAQRRIMSLVRPATTKSSGDQWLKPRDLLARRIGSHGYVLDKPPIAVTNGGARLFLFEGGKTRDGILPTAGASNWLRSLGDSLAPSDGKQAKPTTRAETLRKALEKKPSDRLGDQSPEKFTTLFLGEYPTWCVNDAGQTSPNCLGCEEAHGGEVHAGVPDIWKGLVAAMVALVALALIMVPLYCAFTGSCTWWGTSPSYQPPLPPPAESAPPVEEQSAPPVTQPATPPRSTTPPVVTPDRPRDNASSPPEAKVEPPKDTTPPVVTAPVTPPASTQTPKSETSKETTTTAYPGVAAPPAERTNPYPGLTKNAPPPTYTPETGNKGPSYDWSKTQAPRTTTTTPAAPAATPAKTAPPKAVPAPRVEAKPPTFHVAFFEAKTNLSYEAMNAVTAAAAQSIQTNRPVQLRIVALGPRETNGELWRRRLYAVKDELVRLGVPADRIRAEGTGPYLLTIRPNQPVAAARSSGRRTANSTVDSIPDPMSQD